MLEEKIIENIRNGKIPVDSIKLSNNKAIITDNSSSIPHVFGIKNPKVIEAVYEQKRKSQEGTYNNIKTKINNNDFSDVYITLKNKHQMTLKLYLNSTNNFSFEDKLDKIDNISLVEGKKTKKIQDQGFIYDIISLKDKVNFYN